MITLTIKITAHHLHYEFEHHSNKKSSCTSFYNWDFAIICRGSGHPLTNWAALYPLMGHVRRGFWDYRICCLAWNQNTSLANSILYGSTSSLSLKILELSVQTGKDFQMLQVSHKRHTFLFVQVNKIFVGDTYSIERICFYLLS